MSNKITMKERAKKLLKSAKDRGIEVNLKIRFWEDMMALGCNYCGVDVSEQKGYCLDRFDNNKGYTNENIVVCCKICNYAKRSMGANDFYSWVERAYQHQKKKIEEMAMIHMTSFKEDSVRKSIALQVENKKAFNRVLNSRRMANSETLFFKPEKL
jgi:hypothetical protein